MNLDDLQIETPRLLLRIPRAEDLDPWARMMTDEEAAKFIGGVMPRSVTWRGLMTMIGSWHATGFAMFSVIEKSSGRWVGRLGPWMPDGWPGPEVGWAISRECWGRGYATEGAIAATNWAFDHLGWDRRDSQHRSRQHRVTSRGEEARLPQPRAGIAAGAVSRIARRYLGAIA